MKKFVLVVVLSLVFRPVFAHAMSVGGANPRPESVGGANPRPEAMPDWAIDLTTFLQMM